MVELPKTEAELQAYVDAKLEEQATSLKADYDNKFASQRKKHEDEISKIKADAGKSAEELAQQKLKEQQDADAKELNELRAYKKSSVISEKLAKENLPSYFKNDTRLLNADESEYDKVLKDIKKEYEASLPKGSHTSTIIQQSGGKPTATDKEEVNKAFANALKDLVS